MEFNNKVNCVMNLLYILFVLSMLFGGIFSLVYIWTSVSISRLSLRDCLKRIKDFDFESTTNQDPVAEEMFQKSQRRKEIKKIIMVYISFPITLVIVAAYIFFLLNPLYLGKGKVFEIFEIIVFAHSIYFSQSLIYVYTTSIKSKKVLEILECLFIKGRSDSKIFTDELILTLIYRTPSNIYLKGVYKQLNKINLKPASKFHFKFHKYELTENEFFFIKKILYDIHDCLKKNDYERIKQICYYAHNLPRAIYNKDTDKIHEIEGYEELN